MSLIEEEAGSRRFSLSAAYDLLPVNVIMPEDKEELAMPVNGKKQNIRKKDFLLFAEKCEIEKKTAEKMIGKLCSFEPKFVEVIENSFLDEKSKEAFIALLQTRIKAFV